MCLPETLLDTKSVQLEDLPPRLCAANRYIFNCVSLVCAEPYLKPMFLWSMFRVSSVQS